MGLFASVRPIRNLAGIKARFENLDILLVREITEDLYTAIEHEIVPGVVQSFKIVTEAACLRFFRFAFELAAKQGRKSIHCIHKANILKMADGLYLECFRRVAKDFPAIEPKEMIVDNCCMQLVSKPTQFEVLAAGNLYGTAQLGGSRGLGTAFQLTPAHVLTVLHTFLGNRDGAIPSAGHPGKYAEVTGTERFPLPVCFATAPEISTALR